MPIDWFTVGAQVLNFLVLIWLMKRFFYRPIRRAIDARERRIARELEAANLQKIEAQEACAKFQRKNEEFDQQRVALLSQAKEEADTERHRLLEEVREEAEVSRAKQQEMLRNDTAEFSQAIGRRTREEVFAITRKVLADLASTSLEERISDIFVRRLQKMDDTQQACLGAAISTESSPPLVRSAFELPQRQRAAIEKALSMTSGAEVHVRFECDVGLIGGIELHADGQKMAWNIDDYLESLENHVAAVAAGNGESKEKAKSDSMGVRERRDRDS